MAFENVEAKFIDLKIEYIWLLSDNIQPLPATMVSYLMIILMADITLNYIIIILNSYVCKAKLLQLKLINICARAIFLNPKN
jgi:hypothetical protein